MSTKELEIEKQKDIVQKNIDDRYEILSEINTEKANIQNLSKKETSLKNEIQMTISELDENRNKKSDMSKEFYEVEKKRNDINKSIEEMKIKKEECTSKIKDFEDRINSFQSEYRIKESKYKFLVETEKEKEGYIKSVKSLLQEAERNSSLKTGMHGILANLISVDKKYETAIEMTLGGSIQNIVTDTEEEAKKLVNYLRDNKLGRASFLPISSVKGTKLSRINDKSINGIVGVAADLVDCDKRFEGIILNLLGRTVIVEDIDSAVKLAKQNSYSFKIVTLKGDIINPSGAISGGSVTQKTVSLLGREKEIKALEKELKEINKNIEKMQKEKEEYENSITETLNIFENFSVIYMASPKLKKR